MKACLVLVVVASLASLGCAAGGPPETDDGVEHAAPGSDADEAVNDDREPGAPGGERRAPGAEAAGCTTCGPLPDPWQVFGPLPDPWRGPSEPAPAPPPSPGKKP